MITQRIGIAETVYNRAHTTFKEVLMTDLWQKLSKMSAQACKLEKDLEWLQEARVRPCDVMIKSSEVVRFDDLRDDDYRMFSNPEMLDRIVHELAAELLGELADLKLQLVRAVNEANKE